MKDQELMEKLKNQAVDIPDSLKPENIELLLRQKTRTKKTVWKRAAVAAAAFFIICGSIFGIGIGHMNHGDGEKAAQQAAHKDEGYDAIYEMLQSLGGGFSGSEDGMAIDSIGTEEARAEKQMVQKESMSTGQSAADQWNAGLEGNAAYSGTNVQTDQVDEGDIVKNDGEYIYVLDQSYNTLSIVRAEEADLEKQSVIELDENFSPAEFYVESDRLTILGDDYGKSELYTKVCTYNIQDRKKPGKPKVVTQSGGFKSSRMRDGYIYVFSSYEPQIPARKAKPEQYVPQVCGKLLDMNRIVLPEKPEMAEYLVMTAIDLEKPDQTCDKQSVFDSGEIFYVSAAHIYAASGNYGKNTEIQKFSYGKGKIKHQSAGTVKGYLEDSFSMDEYQGYLRLVTTLETANGGTYNNVYVLDHNMKVTGSILKLAKDERIYSARFMGDTGYFVTFRETDPLFSVDLSNPSKPEIIGRLKIPGFSEYLHFYGENQLIGIGMSTDKDGNAENVKLSMFDIGDPKSVKETDVYVLEGCYDAEALYNHHAVMIDEKKNLIGFEAESEDDAAYHLFQYEKGFRQLLKVSTGQMGWNARGLYIGEYFYLAESDRIRAYGLDDFKKAGELRI